jgi:putative transposase
MPPSVASPLVGDLVGDLDSASGFHEPKNIRPTPNHPRHRSSRLPRYDYSQDGAYFVTVCTNHRVGLFDAINAGVFGSNEARTEIECVWNTLPERFLRLKIDAFVIMPNHVHGILVVDGSQPGDADLSPIVGAYKSQSILAYARGAREGGWLP